MGSYGELDLDGIRALNVWDLASIADCGRPDTSESLGANFLNYVKRDVIEALEDENWSAGLDSNDASEKASEIANEAPSHENYTRWMEAGDLAAWDEEPEAGEWPTEGTQIVAVMLYQIAERLASSLFESYIEWRDNQEEDENEWSEDDEDPDDDDGRPIGGNDIRPSLPDSEDDDLFPANAGSSE